MSSINNHQTSGNVYLHHFDENRTDFYTRRRNPDDCDRNRSSLSNIVSKSYSIDAVMEEFRLNGFDSPYDPDEETFNINADRSIGMVPPGHYLRQKSWPEPEASPSVQLPTNIKVTQRPVAAPPKSYKDVITVDQLRVLSSLPDEAMYSLLRDLGHVFGDKKNNKIEGQMECNFCKTNGEVASYYRSHKLRASGRLSCPVLRAYRCRRCGAHGDQAHTIKYCPLASEDERFKSSTMLRSGRLASGRPRSYNQNVFEATCAAELDPLWAALEKKLML